MTIENLTINWLSRYAGIDDCFAQEGINYNDPDGIARIGSTADVLNAFFVAHLIGKDDVIIISNTNYSQLKNINKNQDINLDDVGTVYEIENYCYIDCLEVICPNVCDGYDLYSQICVDGVCETDSLIESNSPSCGYVPPDPCEGIECPDFCDGTTRYFNGVCVDGECTYDVEEKSVDCGYIESIEKSSFPWWFLGLIAILQQIASNEENKT